LRNLDAQKELIIRPYGLLNSHRIGNYAKHLKDAEEWIDDPEKQKAFAKQKTRKDIYDAMQSLEYSSVRSAEQPPYWLEATLAMICEIWAVAVWIDLGLSTSAFPISCGERAPKRRHPLS
jgi:hypothetical protein